MKKIAIAIGLVFAISCLSVSALATECFNAQGSSATTPFVAYYMHSKLFTRTNILVSNTSGSNVACKITVYDDEGNDVTSVWSKVLSGSTTSGSGVVISTGTGTFDIPPQGTRSFQIGAGTLTKRMYCYAVIEWRSADDPSLRKAVTATVLQSTYSAEGYHGSQTAVNSGQIF